MQRPYGIGAQGHRLCRYYPGKRGSAGRNVHPGELVSTLPPGSSQGNIKKCTSLYLLYSLFGDAKTGTLVLSVPDSRLYIVPHVIAFVELYAQWAAVLV